MPTSGEYDMPAAYGEDHPDFMRVGHTQVAEDCCRALKSARRQRPPNGGRNEHHQLFGSTFPTGPREERALKDLAFFGGCNLNALLRRVVLPPLGSGQARGPPQGRVRCRRDAASEAGGSGRYREGALLCDSR
jgi:hypothetical protein